MKSLFFGLTFGLLTIFGLSACSTADEETVDDGMLHGITLQLGPSGVRQTKSYGGDPNANEHEFIHSLHVFIVDYSTGKVEWVAHETFTGDTDAADGNLIQKAYSDLTLAAGTKTIYAFANMDNVYFYGDNTTTIDDQLDAITTSSNASALSDLSQKIVNDPAGSIDLTSSTKSFIPMCIFETVNLTNNSQTLTVEMERLVCRVDFTIRNRRSEGTNTNEITITSLTMQPLYSTVGLFAQTPNTTDARSATKTVVNPNSEVSEAVTLATGKSHLFSFYVNATEVSGNTPFTFYITLKDESKTYTGTTTATTLPRNSILPVAANFSDYEMSLDVTAQVSPIGGYPVSVYTGSDLTNYTLNLPEGCTFTIAPTMTKDDTEVTMATDGWQLSLNDTSVKWLTLSTATATTGGSLIGQVTAQTGLSAGLKLASKTAENRTADYSITINTVSLSDFSIPTSAARKQLNAWSATPEVFELLSLTKQQ
ncbi:MAG: fimbrial protein [Bacteroidales bacterium]|nr:fimbrial protein [Bacteroidales bacterium]